MATTVYPRLGPSTTSKRLGKKTLCHRLMRNLVKFETHPELWDGTVYVGKPLPRILTLPVELIQQILDGVVEDDELYLPRPNSVTSALNLVCRDFNAHMKDVNGKWNRREAQWRASSGRDRAALAPVIQGLMLPLLAANNALDLQVGIKKNGKRRPKCSVQREARWRRVYADCARKFVASEPEKQLAASRKEHPRLQIKNKSWAMTRSEWDWHRLPWWGAWKTGKKALKAAKKSGDAQRIKHWKAVMKNLEKDGKKMEKKLYREELDEWHSKRQKETLADRKDSQQNAVNSALREGEAVCPFRHVRFHDDGSSELFARPR
ncbi:Hypothetical predicted protein [Lecanosticta acicola]|uniref:Uncharacterized protein n=1 Tax=Lecanosticta acicola TaxID=111012 RepID=A0AAI8Z462_9PEZI|nr:Hypothetical predicted protein [Lecanosticta acicola]